MPKKTKKEKITAEVRRKDISHNAHHTKAPTYDLPAHISPVGQFQFRTQGTSQNNFSNYFGLRSLVPHLPFKTYKDSFGIRPHVSGDLLSIKQITGELVSIQNDLIKTMILALIAISAELFLSKIVR